MNTLDSSASSDNPAVPGEAVKPRALSAGRGDLAPVSNLSGNLRQVRNTSEGSAEMLATCCGFENRHEESPPAQNFHVGARVRSRGWADVASFWAQKGTLNG